MPKTMKPNGFLPSLPRLFTQREQDAYSLIHFCETDAETDIPSSVFDYPAHWSLESARLFASEATYNAKPVNLKAVEENTVPSWLWRHRSANHGGTEAESKAQLVFDRVAGAAAYVGWKKHLFSDENEARNFFDEVRYALAIRIVAVEPRFLATLGVNWAYGVTPSASNVSLGKTADLAITNAMIDAIVSGTTHKGLRSQWQRILQNSRRDAISLRFTDTSHEWGYGSVETMPVILDLLALRHNDGSVNITRLRHAVKLFTILLDLLDTPAASRLAFGFCNLAPLLMALGLSYDSEAARMTAASLTSIITAEATIVSAQMASLRGASSSFATTRETVLRTLRNHRRAAYGDRNDYEKMSVLPQALSLTKGLDLTLVAAAQHSWDEALELARLYGLRHIYSTALISSTALALFMESSTQGIQALPSLTVTKSKDGETFTQAPHPCLVEALARLKYNDGESKALIAYATGYRTLDKAPSINHASLRNRGFDQAALDRIENYLPYVNDVRLAFTPWILGEEFCRQRLKISSKQLNKPNFGLLQHIGFSDTDIDAANRHYYGHENVKGAKVLHARHADIFVSARNVSAEAHIRMAASVQSFLSGDAGLLLELPEAISNTKVETLILTAWRQGLKALTLSYTKHEAAKEKADAGAKLGSRAQVIAPLHTHPHLPARKAKASRHLVGMGGLRGKSGFSRSKVR